MTALSYAPEAEPRRALADAIRRAVETLARHEHEVALLEIRLAMTRRSLGAAGYLVASVGQPRAERSPVRRRRPYRLPRLRVAAS